MRAGKVVVGPATVTVRAWGELPGDRKLPGTLRVLVAGLAAGGVERVGAEWRACWYTAAYRDRFTVHATAELAVAAVLASGWARRLGACKASCVTWSPAAQRTAARKAAART